MQTANFDGSGAEATPPIDELSERLTALANRIDTLNGGRRPVRKPGAHPATIAVANGAAKAEPSFKIPVPPEAPAAAPASRATAPAPGARDAEGRLWPRLPIPDVAASPTTKPETRPETRPDLPSAVTLAARISERDREISDLRCRLLESESQRASQEAQHASALREANAAAVRLQSSEASLASATVDLAAANELIDDLRNQLSAARAASTNQVAAAEERLQRRYEAERSLHIDNTERRLADLQALVADRDACVAALEQTRAAMADDIAALKAQLHDCHAALVAANETVAAKDSHIAFLDTVIKVTRENSEATVKELVAEFDRERGELAARAKAADALQQDLVRLLPKLLERRAAGALPPQAAPEPEAAVA